MEIAHDGASSIGWDGAIYAPILGSEHVFDVPQELGEHLIGRPHLGWRWPVSGDWDGPRPEPAVVVWDGPGVIEAAAAAVVEDPAEDGDSAGESAPPEETPTPVDADPVPDPVEPDRPQTIGDALVAEALAAGPAGIRTADVVAVRGASGGNTLRALTADGRLTNPSRGLYVHPDFA